MTERTPRPGRLAPYVPLDEPYLAFRSADPRAAHRHPLRGILEYGPYTSDSLLRHTDRIRVAILAPEQGREGRRKVLTSLREKQEPTDRRDYVPTYPGFQAAFGVAIEPAPKTAQISVPADLMPSGSQRAQDAVRNAISHGMQQLASVRDQFDVAVLHLPESWGAGLRSDDFDAHDEVKAYGAETGIPTQIINDRTFDFPYKASLAWRLAIALYVKAGGIPWRLADIPTVPAGSAYIGLAYALRGDPRNAAFVTCCSQVFDADGGGMQFVAYDARDPIDDATDARRNPYLSRADMRAVMARSLRLYQRRNAGASPQRIVVHKTTPFRTEELAGLNDALSSIPEIECIEVTRNVAWRGVWLSGRQRPDGYPVHRGTFQQLSDRAALVWLSGNSPSVSKGGGSFYQGGKSIPSPLLLTRHQGRGPLEIPAVEALALSKMDWNNDALYNPLPVTIGYSRVLARTIANVPTLPRREFPYRLFM